MTPSDAHAHEHHPYRIECLERRAEQIGVQPGAEQQRMRDRAPQELGMAHSQHSL